MSEPNDTAADEVGRHSKSESAFRTISEVAGELDLPQHVLRFWESKFPQIKPLKRGGGRRYYRPEDISLLRKIKHLLYADGMTIKGVQKLLREPGTPTAPVALPPDPAETAELSGVLSREDLSRTIAELTALRDDLRAALNLVR